MAIKIVKNFARFLLDFFWIGTEFHARMAAGQGNESIGERFVNL